MARRQWFDYPDTTTPLAASFLNDLEDRKPEVEDLTLNVKDYGAVGDGIHDDTAAFNDAIADLPVYLGWISGSIEVPAGYKCKITSAISLDDAGGLEIVGRGGSPGWPALIWSGGAGTGPMITMNSAYGVQLRNLTFGYDNAAFNGDLITTGWGASSSDPRQLLMENCWLGGFGGANSAATLFKPNKLIISTIRNCVFQDAVIGIEKGADYVVALTIEDCMFARLSGSSIKNPGDIWRIVNNTFEPKADGSAGAIDHTLTYWTSTLTLSGNYFGDVTSGAGTWVKLQGGSFHITGNRSTSPGPTAGSTHYLFEQCFGITFIANELSGGTYGIDFQGAGQDGFVLMGGEITSSTPLRSAGNMASQIYLGSGTAAFDTEFHISEVRISGGDIQMQSLGKTLKLAEGSNAKMGVSTLVAGSIVVSTTAVTANSRIQVTSQADGGTPGWLRVSARTAATSFTITSSSGTDTSSVAWVIFEPA